MGEVLIENLVVQTIVGVHAWERCTPQTLSISLALGVDMEQSMQSDDIHDALNYQEVCDDIALWCDQARAHLLEHLADKIIYNLFAKYPCTSVHIKLIKPHAIKSAAGVGVSVSRTR